MITLIVGQKGSGKTKKLIENVNDAIKNTNGNVVVIQKGLKLTYNIAHEARLIDSDAYEIQGTDALAGFISGICAGNYDVTDIYIDSTLKIIGNDMKVLQSFTEKMNALSALADTKITLLVSVDKDALPKEISSVAVQI